MFAAQRDVRAAVDLCHRDGSLKQAVAKDPAKYIHEDKRLLGILDMYRAAGKKLFVATNSLWDYTHVVMNFLLSGRVGTQKNEDWLEYFDVVITGVFEGGVWGQGSSQKNEDLGRGAGLGRRTSKCVCRGDGQEDVKSSQETAGIAMSLHCSDL